MYRRFELRCVVCTFDAVLCQFKMLGLYVTSQHESIAAREHFASVTLNFDLSS